MAATKTIPLADIRFDGGTQMRVGLDGDTVQEYRAAYESGADMPAIVVYFDGSSYWLADGFHRWHAKHESGAKDIACEVRKGSQRDAIWHAVGANSSHGLRRTNEDKHMAVKTILADAEWSRLSDRQIAEHCGVSNRFVGDVRRQVCTEHTCESGQSKRRTGADGKSYPAVPQHTKPTPKKAEPSGPTAETVEAVVAERIATALEEPLPTKVTTVRYCPNCGGYDFADDETGEYCRGCLEPMEAAPEPPKPAKPAKIKSTVVAQCQSLWDALTPIERVVAAQWFQDHLG